MNAHMLDVLPQSGALEMVRQRLDVESSNIVNQAITLQNDSGTLRALEYLKSFNVAPAIIERVLTSPHLRRSVKH